MPPVFRTVRRLATVVTAGLVGTALLSAPAQAEEAIVGADSPDAIAGSYIVVFEPGSAEADKVAGSAKDLVGDDVEAVFDSGVAGFAAQLSAREARQVAADPAVDFVEQDRVVRLTDVQTNPPWGLDRLDQRSLPLSKSYRTSSRAAGVHAYVIDTGNRPTNRDFGGRATYGYDFVDNDTTANDCNGHGTHVSGTIGGTRYGVAKRVRLVAVKVLGCDGSGSLADVVAGIDWVTRNAVKPAVVNMSLGGRSSLALNNAVKASIASGLTYAVAAGNENTSACSSSPANVPAAITVGATDSRDRRAPFSNYGQCLDVFAPGVNIVSTYGPTTGTATLSGTSMASPHVAGAAAMILSASPHLNPSAVHRLIVNRATTSKVVARGYASPSRLLYTI